VDPLSTFAENATPTPQCHDNHETTIRQTEGPYFKPSSPERADLVEPDTTGRLVEIDGQVTTRSCRPVAGALIDLWHADEHGEYDNAGFRYRGHLFTDAEGRYRFRTILPALYPGRTRHYHFKVQAPEQALLTTQLYFPDEPANRRDVLFSRDLVMRVAEAPEGLKARFDFVLNSERDKGMGRLPGRRNRFDLPDTRWNTEPRGGGLLTGAKLSGRPPRESA
jgi:protocatechuate 3,4-dioxygenase beta subunit